MSDSTSATPAGSDEPRRPDQPQQPQQPPYGAPSSPPHGGGQPDAQQPYSQQPYSQQPYSQQPYGQQPAHGDGLPPLTVTEERNWAMAAHLAPVVLALLSFGVLAFLSPLVIWLMFRRRSRFVDDQAKEALNFEITLMIAYAVGWVTVILLVGFVILVVAWVLSVVFAIQAAMATSRGEPYRYPLSIRFVR